MITHRAGIREKEKPYVQSLVDARWEAGEDVAASWERAQMSSLSRSVKGICSCGVSAVFCTTATVNAYGGDAAGSLEMRLGDSTFGWLVGEDGQTEFSEDGYTFTGADIGDGWDLSWNVMASGSTMMESMVINFSVTNTSSQAQNFEFFQTHEIGAMFPTSLVGGSVSGAISDLNGDGGFAGSLSSDTPIYRAFVDATDSDPFDGFVVGSLLTGAEATSDPFQSGNFAAESFGSMPTLPSAPGPNIDFNMGIALQFTVGAYDTASFSASFVAAIPGPGPIALAGIAGLAQRSRRRRT